MSYYGARIPEDPAKMYVPELDQNYRYHRNRQVLEFDDGTEYSLREAVILAQGRAGEDTLKAVHLVKRTFNGVLMTEAEERDFLLFGMIR